MGFLRLLLYVPENFKFAYIGYIREAAADHNLGFICQQNPL